MNNPRIKLKRLIYAISPEAIRNRPSEFRGKSKKTKGLFSDAD